MRSLSLFVLSAALILIMTLNGCKEKPEPLRIGDTAPSGTLTDINGSLVIIPDAYQGKLSVFLFWEKDCPYCKKEMSALENLYQKMREKGLTIVAVNVGNSKADVEAIAREKGISFPVLLDTNKKLSKKYGVVALPVMIFINRDGQISRKILGGMESVLLKEQIDIALSD